MFQMKLVFPVLNWTVLYASAPNNYRVPTNQLHLETGTAGLGATITIIWCSNIAYKSLHCERDFLNNINWILNDHGAEYYIEYFRYPVLGFIFRTAHFIQEQLSLDQCYIDYCRFEERQQLRSQRSFHVIFLRKIKANVLYAECAGTIICVHNSTGLCIQVENKTTLYKLPIHTVKALHYTHRKKLNSMW